MGGKGARRKASPDLDTQSRRRRFISRFPSEGRRPLSACLSRYGMKNKRTLATDKGRYGGVSKTSTSGGGTQRGEADLNEKKKEKKIFWAFILSLP